MRPSQLPPLGLCECCRDPQFMPQPAPPVSITPHLADLARRSAAGSPTLARASIPLDPCGAFAVRRVLEGPALATADDADSIATAANEPTPSKPDIEMTRQVINGLAAVSITVHDHIIVGKNRHTSFKASGLM